MPKPGPGIALAGVALSLAGAGWLATDGVAVDLATERDLHGTAYVGSAECRRCHEDHHESWHRTHHRTMTQTASERSVLGDFDDVELEYLGVTARMHRDDGGRFLITFAGPEGRRQRTVEVVRTVGSHRYQQYLARERDVFYRLPVAWHVGEGRWSHMNGAFLTPDPEEPSEGEAVSAADYDRHVVRWNDNCVFCHNVAPDPGWVEAAGRFATEVAELGIGCEACHGPGAEHARRNHNPVRRYALHLGDDPDPTIVSPARLSPERSAEVCGRCHGQRITDDVSRFLVHGDPFVPGDDLSDYSRPLFRDTSLEGEEGAFAARFWGDGTPRLTAYEYQGLLQSPCFERGELTCTTCHGMHDGDPAGQMRPERRGDAACTSCHAELAGDEAVARHTGHEPAGEGARCVGCHMPRIVYGLVDVHPSHRIESPDPARQARDGRPDACTGCHVDRTRGWAAREATRLWPEHAGDPRAVADTRLPEAQRALLAGDPVERAVAARALGDAPLLADGARDVRAGMLLDVMERDPYPAVRRIAWRSLTRLAGDAVDADVVRGYRPVSREGARRRAARALEAALPFPVQRPDPGRAAQLRGEAAQVAIHIGE